MIIVLVFILESGILIFGLFDKEIRELRIKNKGMYCEMFKSFIFRLVINKLFRVLGLYFNYDYNLLGVLFGLNYFL